MAECPDRDCKEELIRCMNLKKTEADKAIELKLSKKVFYGILIFLVGAPLLYAMAADKSKMDKIHEIDKRVQSYSVKTDTILFNQTIFREDLKEMNKKHTKQMEKIHDKMERDKSDIIKEIQKK